MPDKAALFELGPDEQVLWQAPLSEAKKRAANNRARLMFGALGLAMSFVAFYLLILFANGIWGYNTDPRSAHLVAVVITGPAILIAFVAVWSCIERFRLVSRQSLPNEYLITDQRVLAINTDKSIYDQIALSDISHTQIDGQGRTQILILARTYNSDEETKISPFYFVHLDELETAKNVIDRLISEDF